MKARQKAKTDMFQAVQIVCDENSEIIAELIGFQTAFNQIKPLIAQIHETEQFRSMPLTGITADKSADRTRLSKLDTKIAGFIRAFASAKHNETLRAEVNFSLTKFLQMREDRLIANSQNIHDLGAANLNELKNYGVTQPLLDALQSAIDAFKASMLKPRIAKGQKTTMTGNLDEIISRIDDILINQMDSLAPYFEDTHPDFFKS